VARISLKVGRTALWRWSAVFLVACAVIIIALVLMLRRKTPGQVETATESGSAATTASHANEPSEAAEPAKSSWDQLKQLRMDMTYTGDFDELMKRRIIRALVVTSKTMYFLDGVRERGITYEVLKEFEKEINQKLKTGTLPLYVVFIPVGRDELLPGLVEGRGDMAAANLTVTPERSATVDFCKPILTGVSELVVTGSGAPAVSRIEDLAGKDVHVRHSSSYRESLEQLNQSFRAKGLAPVNIVPADEYLEDEDILEMVNAGVIPATVVDSHLAGLWRQVYQNIHVHDDMAVRTGSQVAWAVRKNSPKLQELINEYISTHGKGTLFGNVIWKKYLGNADYIKNNTTTEELRKYQATVDFFKKYAGRYDFDYLMIAAQAYQESKLDQTLVSRVGAVGVMQILPSTAADPTVGIKDVGEVENNIHAGVKYMRFMLDTYYKNEPMDRLNKGLFTIASYNAGPGRIAGLRKKAKEMGLNPNVWFRNVEVVAAHDIGRETVQYVSNIYKYYLVYKQVEAKSAKPGH